MKSFKLNMKTCEATRQKKDTKVILASTLSVYLSDKEMGANEVKV